MFSSTLTLLPSVVGDDEVGLAVAVDVRHRHGVGLLPVAKVCWAANGSVVAPARRVQQHAHAVAVVVGDDEVGLAVAVDVRHRHGIGTGRRWRRSAGRRKVPCRPGLSRQQHAHACCSSLIGDDEVGLAVAVDVRHRHGVGIGCRWRRSAGRRRRRRRPVASCSAARSRCCCRSWRRRGRACRRR